MNQSIQTVYWNLGWRPSFVGRYRSRCRIRAVSLSTFHFPGGLIVNVLVVIVIVTCDYDCDSEPVTHLGAPTSWLGTANVGSDCSMKLMGVEGEQRNRFILALT